MKSVLTSHTERDAKIRGVLKKWTDYFRGVENRYRQREGAGELLPVVGESA